MLRYLIVIVILFLPVASHAGSTALAPAEFVISGETDKIVSETVTISNLSNFRTYYNFYSEEERSNKNISIMPGRFALEPGESRAAILRIRPGNESWNTDLNLVAYNANQLQANFRVGDGIKIPIIFTAAPPGTVATVNLSPWTRLLTILVFALDLTLAALVCFLYYPRIFWRHIRSRHKISFI